MVVLSAYVILAAGHLPLMFPLLLLAMGTETLIITLCLDTQDPEEPSNLDFAGAATGIIMTQVASAIMHLVCVSEDAVALALLVAMVLNHL